MNDDIINSEDYNINGQSQTSESYPSEPNYNSLDGEDCYDYGYEQYDGNVNEWNSQVIEEKLLTMKSSFLMLQEKSQQIGGLLQR